MLPRDVVKLAFQFQESAEVPFTFNASPEQQAALTVHYGGEHWREKVRPYFSYLTGVDNFMSLAGYEDCGREHVRDIFGCVWNMGSIHHLIEPPLTAPHLGDYRLPDVGAYVRRHVRPRWEDELVQGAEGFRIITHSFGLFERAWSLRGFEAFCMDLIDEPAFCEQLVESIADWMLQSLDELLAAPADAVMLTDDYADQRGMIFGLDRWRTLFKPHYKRLFARIRKAGVYSIMHVCGCAAPAVGGLIECGLDCLESLQPEAMDIFELKRRYGRDLRFFGGLGSQSVLPFGAPQAVRRAVRKLKTEMARGGGYVLAGAKGIGEEVPPANVIAYLEQASAPR